ncbi:MULTISPECIES: hypothetical protein [Bradyrhizobium]|jgi:hypothetical protein|uniref:hypothetical protein n=1 Tax=Bradyrhizobium TaxID=374 RepID=UPI0010E5F212|nr:hypothetical protein [Bradyrhizobium elkanii]MCS3580331.1 hypothetical protein [Bradyrhizobium elkanii]RYM28552.1 hypothetical protein EWH13_15000 [Bradyrhizobium elkanii]WLA41708.1 hypothetical protein QNJ95_09610 [Bradyrhizobium elkanii]
MLLYSGGDGPLRSVPVPPALKELRSALFEAIGYMFGNFDLEQCRGWRYEGDISRAIIAARRNAKYISSRVE